MDFRHLPYWNKNYPKGLAYSLIERCDILIDKDDLQTALSLPPTTLHKLPVKKNKHTGIVLLFSDIGKH